LMRTVYDNWEHV